MRVSAVMDSRSIWPVSLCVRICQAGVRVVGIRFNRHRVAWKLIAMCAAFLTGCGSIECGEYRAMASDPLALAEVVRWADGNLFAREFSDSEFMLGRLSGPGRYGHSIDPNSSSLVVPDWLKQYEIRFLGATKFHPSAVFIGRRRYQGLIVFRDESKAVVNDALTSASALESRNGRIAVMCYRERGIAPLP